MSARNDRKKLLLALAAGLAVASSPIQATERNQLRALLGLPGQDLTSPLLPGWYFQVNYQHYAADKVVGDDGKVAESALPGGGRARADARVRADVVAPRLTWLSEARVGEEGRFGLSMTVPFVHTDLRVAPTFFGSPLPPVAAGVNAQAAAASGERSGLGDVEIAPFVDWQDDISRATLAMAVVAPTGDYDRQRAVNPGAGNFWTLRPVLTVSKVTENGWELGLRNTYSFNTRNRDTGYTSGQYLHSDGSALYAVRDGLRVGLGGYLVLQTTDDKGAGAPAHGNKARVFALGPVLSWQNESGRVGAEFKVLEEFGARNRPEGRVAWARLILRLD
jgi:hypothetical protein